MRSKSAILTLVAFAAVCLFGMSAQGSTFTWTAGGGGVNTWATAGNWDLGVPSAGDTAQFSGATNRTVTIGGATSIDTINVSGSAQWVFTGSATLNVATAFNYSDSYLPAYGTPPASSYNSLGFSHVDALLAGGMSLTVSSGGLDLDNAGNTFSGGIYIDGGILAAGKLDGDLAGTTLGTGTIYIGDTAAGDTDASLYLCDAWNGTTYAQNIVVRAGNSGQAIIGLWDSRATGLWHSGTVTLNKDVTFVNNSRWDDIGTARSVNFNQSGAITGTGNVNFSGIGSMMYSGTDTYTGATNVNGGYLYITGTANTNVGNFTVSSGDLFVAADGSLGNAANSITLGSTGNFGGLGVNSWGPAINRNITLTGSGGVIASYGYNGPDITGVISDTGGAQRLIYAASGGTASPTGYLDGNNTFGGGLTVADGTLDINGGANYNNTVYGTGNITIEQGGAMFIRGANNVGGGATVLVKRQGNSSLWLAGGILYLDANFMPGIDPASNGVIAIGHNGSGAAVNAALGGTTPIGDGTMALGGWNWTVSAYTGTSLQALVANQTPAADGSKTYYIRQSPNGIVLAAPGTTGALTDLDGTVMNVQLGTQGGGNSWVQFNNNNSFTGTLTIDRNTCLRACADTATGSALGDAGGNIVLRGAIVNDWTLNWTGQIGTETLSLVNNTGGGVAIAKNNISYDGGVHLNVDDNNSTARTTYFTAASLTRVGDSTLAINGVYTDIGAIERFLVTAAPAVTDNMVAPYYWNDKTYEFLTYDTVNTPSTGFNRVTAASAGVVGAIAGAGATNIVYTAGETVAGTSEVYALRTTGALSGGTVQVDSGGVIFAPTSAITCSTNFNFGANEAVLITPNNAVTLSGTLSGSGGLTKAGVNSLILAGNNNATLSGNITINEGTLYALGVAGTGNGGTVTSLGSGSVVLDGGTLAVSGTYPFFNTVIANNIVLATNGGTVRGYDGSSGSNNVYYTGNISGGPGSGPLMLDSCNGLWIEGTNNTYTGGTIIGGNTINAQIAATSSLGAGDVVCTGTGRLYLYGDANINPQARLILQTWNASANFESRNPVIGSLEGNGSVILGQNGNTTYNLTLGGNNASTDFYGTIGDCGRTFGLGINNGLTSTGGITKVGTGTFTMWGQNWYVGLTTVSNGTLDNNGLISGAVTVGAAGVGAGHGASAQSPIYGGEGTTLGLVTVNAGGAVVGSGIFNGGLTVQGGMANLTGATVNGPFASNGTVSVSGVAINGSFSVSGGTYSGDSTIGTGGNYFEVLSGAAFSGTHTISAPILALEGGTFTGTNNITVANLGWGYEGLYLNGYGGDPGSTVTGNGSVTGNVYVYGGSFGGTYAITGNVWVEDYNGDGVHPVFQGNHTIHGNLTTGTNAIIAPHNGVAAGTMTVVGDVTLDHSTTLNFNLGQVGTVGGGVNDLITITGNLSLDGTLNVAALTNFGAGTYTLITYTGALSGAGLTQGTMPSGLGFTYTIDTTTAHEVNLDVVTPYPPGDTNHDGVSNSLDIDAIYHHFGAAATSQWKVATDGLVVGQQDVTYELHTYFGTSYADANLDKKTDFVDFQVLLDHWQASGPNIGWAQGDFDGSGTVDFLDFQKLLDYWNPGGWHFAPAQAPEPATLSLILLGGLGLLRRSRKHVRRGE